MSKNNQRSPFICIGAPHWAQNADGNWRWQEAGSALRGLRTTSDGAYDYAKRTDARWMNYHTSRKSCSGKIDGFDQY
ncbi:hypothetical protein F6P95_11675 [Escherichia coli]|nr:hypothetical protein F6P95_11675 [Escherichia coli]